jgi:hypothetical protein
MKHFNGRWFFFFNGELTRLTRFPSWKTTLVICSTLLIQYFCRYLPCQESVSIILILWTYCSVVTGTQLTFSRLVTYIYICCTATLTSRRCILYIYSTNKRTEYFKHAAHSLFFPLQNAVYFIMLRFLVPVLFTFYIQVC